MFRTPITRRAALAALSLATLSTPFAATAHDSEPIEWVMGHAAGGGTTFALAGAGSPHHLATELFRERAGLTLVHTPYRGAAPAVQDLRGGQVPFGFMDTASVQQPVASGKLRAIDVASPKRLPTLPDVPTLAEQGLAGVEAYASQGLVVPAAAAPEWTVRLSKTLNETLNSTAVKARRQVLGLEALPGTPAQMTAYVQAERERWGKLIKANNIKLD